MRRKHSGCRVGTACLGILLGGTAEQKSMSPWAEGTGKHQEMQGKDCLLNFSTYQNAPEICIVSIFLKALERAQERPLRGQGLDHHPHKEGLEELGLVSLEQEYIGRTCRQPPETTHKVSRGWPAYGGCAVSILACSQYDLASEPCQQD